MNKTISIAVKIRKPISEIWNNYTTPEKIKLWNHASADWHCPEANLNLEINGKFKYRMESTQTQEGFDFTGKFLEIKPEQLLRYQIDDGRKVTVNFLKVTEEINQVSIVFEAEETHTIEQQKQGWLAILNNFKLVCES